MNDARTDARADEVTPHRPEAPARVLVTGAAGRLGSTVARHLHRAGFDVSATDVVAAADVAYPFALADLLDHRQALTLLDGIDVLLHVGNHPGIGSMPPQQVFNENVSMNENMFQGAAEQGVRKIVFCSTLQLIGSHPDQRTVVDGTSQPRYPLDERAEPDPSNVYALSKAVSEMMLQYYARRCGLDCIAVRFPLLHHGESRFRVIAGEERAADILEGFSGLTYDDAASLMAAVVRAELPGYRVYMPATSHRHRDLSMSDLIKAHYPGVPSDLPDLIDISTIIEDLDWRPAGRSRWQDDQPTTPDETSTETAP